MKDKFLKIAFIAAAVIFAIFILGGFIWGQVVLWDKSWLVAFSSLIIGGFAAIPLWEVECKLIDLAKGEEVPAPEVQEPAQDETPKPTESGTKSGTKSKK